MFNVIKGLAKELSDKTGTDSLSTEEVCSEVRETNVRTRAEIAGANARRTMPTRRAKTKVQTRRQRLMVEGKYILASMYVSALYPSLQWEQCAAEVRRAAEE